MSRSSILVTAAVALLALTAAGPGSAQRLAVDRGVRAAGLWCFPHADDASRWSYLPATGRLARDAEGLPQFSFVRYVSAEPSATDGASTIARADGGGVLHMLVLYDTPAEQVADAQAALRDAVGDDDLVLAGPIVFDSGRYTLVSSILGRNDDGDIGRRLLATGRAPVLEGDRIALSFALEAEQATLLLASLRQATPDVSLVFEMTFSGLAEAYDATLEVDWTAVREHRSMSAGGSAYFIGADAQAQVDELLRDGAVSLESRGSDTASEALLARVYDKLIDLLFAPVEPEHMPDGGGGLLDALAAATDPSGPLGSRATTGWGASVGYRHKHLTSAGKSVLDFRHAATVSRHTTLVAGVGDVMQRLGDDPRFFRAVNLADPTFEQRVVHVAIDGALAGELAELVNSVTVTLRKQHPNGQETVRELVVDGRSLDTAPGDLRLVYGWNGDDDRLAWLGYDVRMHWSFLGGGELRTPWQPRDAAMINLFTPYERRSVEVLAGDVALDEAGVRAVVVEVRYPFFGQERRQQAVVRAGADAALPRFEITLPSDHDDYAFTLTWMLADGARVRTSGRDASGLIFLDPPAAADVAAATPLVSGGIPQ